MKNLYLGYGCVKAVISGSKLIIDCWRTTTSMVVSNLYCTSIKGEVTLTKEVAEDDETDIWSAYVSANTFFVLDVQSQYDVVFYWDGNTVFEVASAWFGGGERCFRVGYKGSTGNKGTKRKQMSIFKVETISEWDNALKALEIVNFV